jgi:hypothetical protein
LADTRHWRASERRASATAAKQREASYAACAENGPSAGAEGAAAVIVQICRMRPGITPELARLEIVSGLMNLGTSCADFKGAGI